MKKRSSLMRLVLPAASLLLAAGLTLAALQRLQVDTDIVRSMPSQERVMRDALEIFASHPVHDQVAVDIAMAGPAPDQLVALGQKLEARMRASGLFSEVGHRQLGVAIPELLSHLPQRLPFLLAEEELERDVAPRLEPEAVARRLQALAQSLHGMEGIGQAGLAAADPLNLRELILARLAPLAPTPEAKFYRGSLLSADGRHLLVLARPLLPGSNTGQARQLARFFAEAESELLAPYQAQGLEPQLTVVGAHRAALDNEEIIRHDVQLALLLSTLGIALLLFFTFPRPLLGVLALLPSLVGTAAALFVYSLLFDSISILVLGFGGALISITVDFGITYLLLLDRLHATSGREVAHEVRVIGGKMALLTTVCAFLVLSRSGFPMFTELGVFTALGFAGTYLYVMLVFPRIFARMPPGPERPLPLRRLVDWLGSRGTAGALVALALFCALLPFARPVFRISLQEMSSVRAATREAEARFTATWGDSSGRVYLMTRAKTLAELQRDNDRLLRQVEEDMRAGQIRFAFVPSMLFPGPERSATNFRAWHAFWTPERRAQLENSLAAAGRQEGFSRDAFSPFLRLLTATDRSAGGEPPPALLPLLSIRPLEGGQGYTQFIALQPESGYAPATLFARYRGHAKVFDGPYFAQRLGEILFSTFLRGLLLIVAMVALFHLLFSLSPRLTALTLLPPFFAFVCTLGTLWLIGHPLDIPALMLAIIIFGMGDDYAVYTVYGYQWYRDDKAPSYLLVRTTVFMAAASSLIGFGVLCFAEHSLLRSVGLTSVLGIGYSLLGACLLLPPLLRRHFVTGATLPPRIGASLHERVIHRYRLLEAYPRLFVRGKLRFDPMFRDLPALLPQGREICNIYDIGCGFGVPACWLLEYFSGSRVFGIDPDTGRVRVAALASGERGRIRRAWATDRPELPEPADLVLLLDMLHYLDDGALQTTLEQVRACMTTEGLVLIRHSQRSQGRRSWRWYLEDKRVHLRGHQTFYRNPEQLAGQMESLGFTVLHSALTDTDRELAWLLCQKKA